MRAKVVVSGHFDDLRSRHVRFLEAAANLGDLHLLIWSDAVVKALIGRPPKFPEAERTYLMQAIRFVSRLSVVRKLSSADRLPALPGPPPDIWAVDPDSDTAAKRSFCEARRLGYRALSAEEIAGFPVSSDRTWELPTERRKAIVTGCYDWLHSGHVRFFEEASEYGDLYVAVGNDVNVRALKGRGHPLLPEAERRYMVQSIRYVKQAVITKGMGWMDAAPNVAEIRPDLYIVNEDGDRPEKRAFCRDHGLTYVVLSREPKEGLVRRSSTDLRGF